MPPKENVPRDHNILKCLSKLKNAKIDQWLSLVTHPVRWSASEPGVRTLPPHPFPSAAIRLRKVVAEAALWGSTRNPKLAEMIPANFWQLLETWMWSYQKNYLRSFLPEMMYYKLPWFLRRKWFRFCSGVCFLGKRMTTELNSLGFPPFWRSQWKLSCHIRAGPENHQSVFFPLSWRFGWIWKVLVFESVTHTLTRVKGSTIT